MAVILASSSLGFALFPSNYTSNVVTSGQVYDPEPVITPVQNNTTAPYKPELEDTEPDLSAPEIEPEAEVKEPACAAVIDLDLATDKQTYRVGEDVEVTGDFYVGPVEDPGQVEIVYISPTGAEFIYWSPGDQFDGDFELEPYYCGFTFEHSIKVSEAGTWKVLAFYGKMTVEAEFEVDNSLFFQSEEPRFEIIGSRAEECRAPVIDAFERLHHAESLEYLTFVNTWVTTIECTSENEREWGFGWYDGRPKTISLASYTFDGDSNQWGWNMDDGFIAGVIVHEGFHVYQFQSERELPDIDIEVEAGLYQTKAEFAMNHSNFPWMTALEYCHYRVDSLYSTYSLGEDTDEIHIDYCGEPATGVAMATAQDAVVDNSTGLNVVIPDSNITNVEDPIGIPTAEPEFEKEEKEQSNSTNWFIELWSWFRGMIN